MAAIDRPVTRPREKATPNDACMRARVFAFWAGKVGDIFVGEKALSRTQSTQIDRRKKKIHRNKGGIASLK